MTVRLHIERLVVEGLELSAADGARLESAIADELSAQFTAEGRTDWSGFAVPALQPLHLAHAPRDGSRGLGRQVGEALYARLKP